MFKKNDAALHNANAFIRVFLIVYLVICAIAFIVLCATGNIGAGFLVLIGGLISAAILWIIFSLIISAMVDLKLIRNKLYGESNEDLDVFLKGLKSIDNVNVKANVQSQSVPETQDTEEAKDNQISKDV